MSPNLPPRDPALPPRIIDAPVPSQGRARVVPTSPPPSRIVVSETLFHQESSEEPTSLSAGWVRFLETSEQPFIRKLKVGNQWEHISCGWLKDVSLIFIRNDEGLNPQSILGPKEKAEIDKRIIEIGITTFVPGAPNNTVVETLALVRPRGEPNGEAARFEPYPSLIERMRIRCREGVARCVIALYPR